jgi:hypothetical protein
MKTFKIIFAAIVLSSCQNGETKQAPDPNSIQSFEIYGMDTSNRMDVAGRKQGLWYIRDTFNQKIIDTVIYKDNKIVE